MDFFSLWNAESRPFIDDGGQEMDRHNIEWCTKLISRFHFNSIVRSTTDHVDDDDDGAD
jgi:hypothetical protein